MCVLSFPGIERFSRNTQQTNPEQQRSALKMSFAIPCSCHIPTTPHNISTLFLLPVLHCNRLHSVIRAALCFIESTRHMYERSPLVMRMSSHPLTALMGVFSMPPLAASLNDKVQAGPLNDSWRNYVLFFVRDCGVRKVQLRRFQIWMSVGCYDGLPLIQPQCTTFSNT
jgi:hypothetical protein